MAYYQKIIAGIESSFWPETSFKLSSPATALSTPKNIPPNPTLNTHVNNCLISEELSQIAS